MRLAALVLAVTVAASCSRPAEITWRETAQLVEGLPAAASEDEAAAPTPENEAAAQPTHHFFIAEGEAPRGSTLSLWGFKISGGSGDVGAFRAAIPGDVDLALEVQADGETTTLMQLVRRYAFENPILGLHTPLPETSAEWIACGAPLSSALLIYHPMRDDLAVTVLGFAHGAPGEDGAIYCGARSFHIPQ